ncbi:TetR/AcrR family transcriptional regulator C-terminal domain-containing protein [Ruegeria pomeroyi]|nr:TetR/AcrR family transcriptional regulator C-terminal domain-containing protein [Ruegeria pomeroyi]
MLPIPNPPRKSRRKPKKNGGPALSKEAIITKALEIIDRDGIEAFSMRNLAKALGVYPTAIYWYLPNRSALIGEVIAAVLTDLVPTDESLGWKSWLRSLFRNYRTQIQKHPNIAPMIGVQLVSNASVDFEMIERILDVLRTAGFSDDKLPAAYSAVIGAMVGFTTQEFALVPSDDRDEWEQSMQSTIAGIDAAKFPTTTTLMPELTNRAFILRWENGTTAPLDDGFDMFAEAMILGLERLADRI